MEKPQVARLDEARRDVIESVIARLYPKRKPDKLGYTGLAVRDALDSGLDTDAAIKAHVKKYLRETTLREGKQLPANRVSFDESRHSSRSNTPPRINFAEYLEGLGEDEKRVLVAVYQENRELTEVAEELGIKFERARFIRDQALAKIRRELSSE